MEALEQVNTNVAGSSSTTSPSSSMPLENMPKVVDITTFNNHVHLVDDLDGSDSEGSPLIQSLDISHLPDEPSDVDPAKLAKVCVVAGSIINSGILLGILVAAGLSITKAIIVLGIVLLVIATVVALVNVIKNGEI